MLQSKRIRFDNAGYYFLGILIIAILGFTPTYITAEKSAFNGYVHFHAFTMSLWLLILIAQPFLIRNGKNNWHKAIGKFSYFFFPVLIIAMLLLVHSGLKYSTGPLSGGNFFIPFKDMLVIVPCYCLAMYYRKDPVYHAKFMIGSSFQVIEPGLARFVMGNFTFPEPGMGYPIVIGIIDLLIILFIIGDRNQKRGRWIFPAVLLLTIAIQAFLLNDGPESPFFKSFMNWFISLNLT